MEQSGLSRKDVVALVVILFVLAVGGAVFWRSRQRPASRTVASSPAAANQPAHKPADAQPVVQKAFDAALGYARTQDRTPQGGVDIVKPYLSADLYNKLTRQVATNTDHNVVLCGQTPPDSAQAVLNDTSGDIATVLVNEAFGAAHTTVTTTVDLKSLKLVSLTCPPGAQ